MIKIYETVFPPYGFNKVVADVPEYIANKLEKKEKLSDEDYKVVDYICTCMKKEYAEKIATILENNKKLEKFKVDINNVMSTGKWLETCKCVRDFFRSLEKKEKISDSSDNKDTNNKKETIELSKKEYDSMKEELNFLREEKGRLRRRLEEANNILDKFKGEVNNYQNRIERNII